MTLYAATWPKKVKKYNGAVEDGEKTVWVQLGLGRSVTSKGKTRIELNLDATPIGWDGRVVLFEIVDKRPGTKGSVDPADYPDDDLPF